MKSENRFFKVLVSYIPCSSIYSVMEVGYSEGLYHYILDADSFLLWALRDSLSTAGCLYRKSLTSPPPEVVRLKQN